MTLKELCLMKDIKIVLDLDARQNWIANIEPMLEVVDNGMLTSTCGRGLGVGDALMNLCQQISGKRVRLSRGDPAERFDVPTVVL